MLALLDEWDENPGIQRHDNDRMSPSDQLRTVLTASHPDPRTHIDLADHHADVACIQIDPCVPELVAIQFETARNLCLYAWHVYRFHMVASAHAMSTLEMGLRIRFPDPLQPPYQRSGKKRAMLAGLLRYAIDNGVVRNEGFNRWHVSAQKAARNRLIMKAVRKLEKSDSQEPCTILIPDEISPLPEDYSWDLVHVLKEILPSQRNELAHGSSMLIPHSLDTLELVAEILNQLFALSEIKVVNLS